MSDFTNITDYVLNQILAYQDANELWHNTERLRDALEHEHVWSNTVDANLGDHKDDFIIPAYLGTNSVTADAIAAGAVGDSELANAIVNTSKLKTSTSETSTSATSVNIYITSNYAFLPMVKIDSLSHSGLWTDKSFLSRGDTASPYGQNTSYRHEFRIQSLNSAQTVYFKYTYVTASPPHNFAGCGDWGLFLFQVKEKSNGRVFSSNLMIDPIWSGDWSSLPKNHPGRIAHYQHPFSNVQIFDEHGLVISDSKDAEFFNDYEIVLVDLRALNEEIISTPQNDKLIWLKSQAPMLIEQGISVDDIAKFENIQQEKVDIEIVTMANAESKIAEAKAKRDEKLAYIEKIKSDLTQWELTSQAIKDGIIEVDFDFKMAPMPVVPTTEEAIELEYKKVEAREKPKANRITKHKKLEEDFKLQGKSLAQAINENLIPIAANADDNLDQEELDQIPQAFKESVRCVRNNAAIAAAKLEVPIISK